MAILNDFGPFGLALTSRGGETPPIIAKSPVTTTVKTPSTPVQVPAGHTLVPIGGSPLPKPNVPVTIAAPPPPSSTGGSTTSTVPKPYVPNAAPPIIAIGIKPVAAPPSSTTTSTSSAGPVMVSTKIPIGLSPPILAIPPSSQPVQIRPQSGNGTAVISPFPPLMNTVPGTVKPPSYQLPVPSTVSDPGKSVASQIQGGGSINLANSSTNPGGATSALALTGDTRNLAIAAVGGLGAGYFGYKFQGPIVGVIAAMGVFLGVKYVMAMQAPQPV